MPETGLTICMIDDDEHDVFLARRVFSRHAAALNFISRSDADVLLDDIEQLRCEGLRNGGYPDFILLDINMPKVSGLSLLERLKAHDRLKLIPVFIFTTSDLEEHIEAAYSGGASAYITKPHSVEEYARFAQAFVAFWAAVAKRPGLPIF